MIDLGSMTDRFSETGQKVVRRAIEVSKSLDHNSLSLSHVLAALSQVESALFVEGMKAIPVDPGSVTRLLEQVLSECPVHVGRKMAIPEMTRDLFNRALRRARAQRRQRIESYDLFATLFTDQNGAPAELLRRLGIDPALAVLASDKTSVLVRRREEQIESLGYRIRKIKSGNIQPFNFSRLTAGFFHSMVTMLEKGVTPAIWDATDVSLTEQERQQVEAIVSSLQSKSIFLMNDATIWSRAIYPLLVLAEEGGLEAWAQLPLRAQFPGFVLEGIADGVVGYNVSGPTTFIRLVVVKVKRESGEQDPLIQLYGAMLAAAKLNWEKNYRISQEIFGCYTLADNWIFARGRVANTEVLQLTMTVALSRAYSETNEAETILRILKSIMRKAVQEVAYPA
jgi:hypothetical protein